MDAEAPVLDTETIDQLRSLDEMKPGFFAELVQTYVSSAQDSQAAISRALRDGDGDALRRAAHSWKGSAGSVGAAKVAALCAELEKTPGAEDRRDVAARLMAAQHQARTALLSLGT